MKKKEITIVFTVNDDVTTEDLYDSLGLSFGWPIFVSSVRMGTESEGVQTIKSQETSVSTV